MHRPQSLAARAFLGFANYLFALAALTLVRHPMYAGTLPMLVGLPLGLGSLWALGVCLPLVAALVWRLLDEERYLAEHLPGYADYRARTRYRLIPWIF